MKPCYPMKSSLMGGLIKEAGKKIIFYYPGPEKRPVTMEVTTWIGYSPGAMHYYGKVKEDDNYAWNRKQNTWFQPWDKDERFIGRSFESNFDTEEEAYRFCRCVIRENFSPETHYVRSRYCDDENVKMAWNKRERKPSPSKENQLSVLGYYHKKGKE